MLDMARNERIRASSTVASPNRPSSSIAVTFNSTTCDRPATSAGNEMTHDRPPTRIENLLREKLPEAIEKLENRVAVVQTAMSQLQSLANLPQSELINDFGILQKSDGERSKIRTANLCEARQLAESYLMSYKDLQRRFDGQRRRMDVLEGRTARMETLFGEQIQLNKEIGAEAMATLTNLVEDERHCVSTVMEANKNVEIYKAETEMMKNRMDILENEKQELRTQMDIMIQEKSAISKELQDCRTENHSLKLAKDQLKHEYETQGKLLESKEALIEELNQNERRSIMVVDEKENLILLITREREEAKSQLEKERQQHQQKLDQQRQDLEQKIGQLTSQLETERQAELGKMQSQQNGQMESITASLQKAAENHQKLEQERNKLFADKKYLEENLNNYKRRFVAELNRELSSMCNHLGTGLNTALMEVLVKLNSEHGSSLQLGSLSVDHENREKIAAQSQTQNPSTITIMNEITVTDGHENAKSNGRPHLTTETEATAENNNNVPTNFTQPPAATISPVQVDNHPCQFFSPVDSSISMLNININNHQNHQQHLEPENPFVDDDGSSKFPLIRRGTKSKEKENAHPNSTTKKRPIIKMVRLKSNEPPHKSRQVPINILAATKPWRPTATTACKPSGSQKMAIAPIAKLKKKNDARNLKDHLQKATTTNCNMPLRQIQIGAPMFTSTPAKKRQFPAFQL